MQSESIRTLQESGVAQVFPECRADMRRYLECGAAVGIREQTEVGESPPFAIFVLEEPEFWIDCCDSHQAAVNRARNLGLEIG
jgi:hypothetical protein